MRNEKAKKAVEDVTGKVRQPTKRHRIKVVGSWVAMPENLMVIVYEAPNMEAMMKSAMEPEAMNWIGYTTTETMPVMTGEDAMKFLK